MRSLFSILLAAATLASCTAADSAASTTTTGATTGTATAGGVAVDETTATTLSISTVPTSTVAAATDPARCEDKPDLSGYQADPPLTLRPCEAVTELEVSTPVAGTGYAAATGDTVIADFTGIRAADGVAFDNSYGRGIPVSVVLGEGNVIEGWDSGLIGAQTGEVRRLDIPAALAYGDSPPSGTIQPGDDLTFVLEIRAVIPAAGPQDAPTDIAVPTSVGAAEATVEVVNGGTGDLVQADQTVVVHMILARGDNRVVVFNSWDSGDPLQVFAGNTLPGISQAISGARVGDVLKVIMPPVDAFGEAGNPQLGLPAGVDTIAILEIVAAY